MLHLTNDAEALGEMNLSGNMTRQVESDLPVENDASHVANVGRLVEDMELKMRNLLRTREQFPYSSATMMLMDAQRKSTSGRRKMLLGI